MILVSGATGNIGREVVDLLLKQGKEVTALTRNPAVAKLRSGIPVMGWDPSRPHRLEAALDNVEAVFISPRAMGEEDPGEATKKLLALVADRGTERVTLLSAVTVEYGGGYRRFAKAFETLEDAIKKSGLHWTILRCTDFSSNALAWAPQVRSTGVVRGAYGEAATSTIHDGDVAAVSVQTLVNTSHAGRSYVLSGPESLTQRNKVQLIGDVIGKQIPWEEISPEEFRESMISRGLPSEIPDRMLGYLADNVQQPGPSSDMVQKILGRPALTFEAWVAEHRTAFE